MSNSRGLLNLAYDEPLLTRRQERRDDAVCTCYVKFELNKKTGVDKYKPRRERRREQRFPVNGIVLFYFSKLHDEFSVCASCNTVRHVFLKVLFLERSQKYHH